MRIPIPGFAVLAFILCNIPLAAQQGSVETLAGLYQGIISDYANGKAPRLVDVTNLLDKVPEMDAKDIESALPLIEEAIQSTRLEVRSYGELGMFAISQRSDSAQLIGHLAPVVARNLQDPDVHIRKGAVLVLSGMRPKPPEEAISYLLSALQFDHELGPGIVYGLVQIDPNRTDIAHAIDVYMKTNMATRDQRVDTLNALASRQVTDRRLISDMATNFSDESEDVRLSAIRAIVRSGPAGVEASKQQLRRLAGPDEPSENVRDEAQRALGKPQDAK
jgi:HEAT repeat protein